MKIKNTSAFLCIALAVSWASCTYAQQQVAPPPDLWLGFNGNYNDSNSISTVNPPHDSYGVLNTMFTNDVPNATCGTSNLFVPGDGSYVEADNVSDLNFNTGNPFSVSAWFKTTTGGVIWAKSTAAADSGGDEQTVSCFIGADDTQDNGDGEPAGSLVVDVFFVGDFVSTATGLNDGNWHHVVVTYSSSSIWSLYIDGVLDNTASLHACDEGANDEGPWSFTVGATLNDYFPLETGVGDPFDGEIDEVGVWAYTLTSNQVASVYNNGIPFQSINITQQPVGTAMPLGNTATLTVAGTPVNISGTLSYQWESNGVPIINATSATYTTPPLSNTTVYSCLLTVGSITVSSQSATVTVWTPPPAPGNTVVFSDNFANGSTINSATPAPPTASSTSYEEITAKAWVPNPPTIGPGSLEFGYTITTGGGGEVQALFTTSPVTLQTPGDYIQLVVAFTNVNILASDTQLGMGLFNAEQVAPLGKGLNGTANSKTSTATTGGAQNWLGYIGQIAFLGGTTHTQFSTRPAQNNGDNLNQLTEITGSSSSGYQNSTTLNASDVPNVALTIGDPYTEVLTYTLLADGSLQLQTDLYETNTSGTLISSEIGNSGTPVLTSTFDAFSIGWRSKDDTTPTGIDLNSVKITTMLTPSLQMQSSGTHLTFTWTNPAYSLAFSTNVAGPYVKIPGASNPFVTTASGSTGFFRLVSP
jgi:hypothetical protein